MDSDNKMAPLNLGEFIRENIEVILTAWEDFARRFWQGPMPDSKTLRNGARAMIEALVEDMAIPQSVGEQKSKSEGAEAGQDSAMNRAAIGHALARVEDGFDIGRMVAEFRALRASVNRIWWDSLSAPGKEQIDEMARFNEALDQLLFASVTAFTERVSRSRQLFLGILSHDMRQPLNSMIMFADLAKEEALSDEVASILSRMENCCRSMSKMLSNLLDFTTSQLGSNISIQVTESNLGAICKELVDEVQAVVPEKEFHLEIVGDLEGEWDTLRLRQLVSNLLSNAVQHGSEKQDITVTLRGADDDVVLAVHNRGKPIPPQAIKILFDPMVRLPAAERNRPQGSVGLGLYICRLIAVAHGGDIHVDSSVEDGTTFTVTLPKRFASEKSVSV